MYIYIYIERERERRGTRDINTYIHTYKSSPAQATTLNPPLKWQSPAGWTGRRLQMVYLFLLY